MIYLSSFARNWTISLLFFNLHSFFLWKLSNSKKKKPNMDWESRHIKTNKSRKIIYYSLIHIICFKKDKQSNKTGFFLNCFIQCYLEDRDKKKWTAVFYWNRGANHSVLLCNHAVLFLFYWSQSWDKLTHNQREISAIWDTFFCKLFPLDKRNISKKKVRIGCQSSW